MEIIYCGKKNESLSFKKEKKCFTWNNLFLNKDPYEVLYVFDSKQATFKDSFYYVKQIKNYTVYEKDYHKENQYVLLSDSAIDENWAYPTLKKVISPNDHVCVVALTFFDDTKNESDWNRQFKEGQGFEYRRNTDIFYKYGIQKNQITWIRYFNDSKEEMMNKIMNSSILFIPGGAPDLFMKRIKELKLKRLLKNYKGTIIGYSAGAVAQLQSYHITPDDEYPEFMYLTGLGYMGDFDIEVHYHESNHQKHYIQKVLEEKKKDIYAIYEKGGVLVKNQSISLFGKVEVFKYE